MLRHTDRRKDNTIQHSEYEIEDGVQHKAEDDENEHIKGSDSGCIEIPRIRTIILSGILLAFLVHGFSWLVFFQNYWAELADKNGDSSFVPDRVVDVYRDLSNAYAVAMAGSVIAMIGCIMNILLFIIPGCDDKLGRMAGVLSECI